ncbi:MAG: response regulator [Hyphomonadaceae bacterium]
MNAAEGQKPLKILVVDDRAFQRRLVTETLRAAGRIEIEYADSADHCIFALAYFQPDVAIIDWDLCGGEGLALVRRIRSGEAGDGSRPLPIIMVASRNRLSDVHAARNSGVDEFVLRPFSTGAIIRRIQEVQARRREFIESTVYTGPCRRRRPNSGNDGPRRRLFDTTAQGADAPDVQIKKGLARMYVERITTLLANASTDSADSMREVSLACAQLSTLASDMDDRLLMSATSSLFNYVKGVGANGVLSKDVAQAHLDAILQLAQLPNSQFEIRQTVTQQLTVMVTKKLRQAGEAA